MPKVFDEAGECQYLASFIAGLVESVEPNLCTDYRYVAALTLAAKGRPDSPETFSLWLAERGAAITDIKNLFVPRKKLPSEQQVLQNIKALNALAMRRGMHVAATRLDRLSRDFSVPSDDLYPLARQEWANTFNPLENSGQSDPTVEAFDWFERHLDGLEATGIHQTWCPKLDELIGPIGPDLVMLIAAMTSHGKTIWMNKMKLDLAAQGVKCMTSSPDMGPNKIIMRLVSMQTGIPYWKIDRHSSTHPTLTPHEREMARACKQELERLPIKVERTNSVPELIARAERWGAQALFVDYAELFRMPDVPGSNYLNYEQVAAASLRLADIAYKMAVLVASQVNSLEPSVYSASWGKNLPNRADIMLWIKRNRETGFTELHVLKNRGKGLGVLQYYVLPASMQPIELKVVSSGFVIPIGV